MKEKMQKYFLAANSCYGFKNYFSDSFSVEKGWHAYLIKGGPGTGKSSLMKYLAARGASLGEKPILCPCSSDPLSLDGVIFENRKTVILDATSPHTLEPQLPGACEEIINLGEFWNGKMLKSNFDEIYAETENNRRLHRTASAFLKAAGQVMESSLALVEPAIDKEKAAAAAYAYAKKHLAPRRRKSSEQIRFLQGATPLGIVSYSETVTEHFSKLLVFSDPYGCAGNAFMQAVREYVLAAGYDIITVKNAFLPDKLIDHILIPELSLAFVTENSYFKIEGDNRKIHSRRFADAEKLREIKQRFLFRRRLTRELLRSACEALALAKASHDRLEKYYIGAMDFEKIPPFAEKLAEKIFMN